jgi:hypothetical protein
MTIHIPNPPNVSHSFTSFQENPSGGKEHPHSGVGEPFNEAAKRYNQEFTSSPI